MSTKETKTTDRSDSEPSPSWRLIACDYFRLARNLWPTMLRRLCQLGVDAVRVSVPWAWHQPTEQWVDLHGITHPQRDLIGFLQLCAHMQLPVHLSVELLPEAGLIAWGIPLWLLQKYPEAQAVLPGREPDVFPLPSLEHPVYVEHVLRWLGTLSDTLLELQSSAGPIAAISLAAPPARDYNHHNARVLWPVWLRQQYDGIGDLNAAWGANYDTFNAIALPEPSPAMPSSANPIPAKDVDDFFTWVDARWFNRRVEWLRQKGWQVPILGPAAPAVNREPCPHVAQVAEDLPTIAIGLNWAETAPVAADGQPAPLFWTVKAQTWEDSLAESEEEMFVVVRENNDLVRVSAPAGRTAIYRLLLNGRLLPVKHRLSRGKLMFDYQLVDQAGFTDMYLVQPEGASCGDHLTTYFHRLLSTRVAALDYTSQLCQDLASALGSSDAGGDTPLSDTTPLPETARAELLEAERSLESARLAVFEAAASLGKIERQLRPIIPRSPHRIEMWLDLSALTSDQRALLTELATDCASFASRIQAAEDSVAALPDRIESLPKYAAAREALDAPVESVRAGAAGWLTRLRVELNAGGLPAAVWTVHDLLAEILRGLTNM